MFHMKNWLDDVCLILGLVSCLLFVSFSSPADLEEIVKEYNPRLFTSQKTRDINPDFLIQVDDQDSFDRLQKSLNKALSEGKKKIEVRFFPGRYFFNNRHLLFSKQISPDVSIRFVGNGCILMPKGKTINIGQKNETHLDFHFSYVTADGKDVNLWTPFYQTDSLIQVVDEKEKLCRIHVPSSCPLNLEFSNDSYVQYTEWYYSRICKIERIRDGFVYFKVPELFKVNEYYNVNYDYRWHKILPRFRFFDCGMDLNKVVQAPASFFEGQAGTFCRIADSKFKSVSFEDFKVFGSQSDNPLFFVTATVFDDYLLLFNSQYIGQRSRVAYVCKTNNVFVQNCRFKDQYTNVLVFDDFCVRSEVYNNEFENCGLDVNISMCVRCSGEDYLVGRNSFVDFGYKAIAVGLGYKSKSAVHSRGVVEDNVIYYTDDYVTKMDQHGLIDSGAISIGTINEKAVVRYNFINNIAGIGSNRGIYCDDGAKNFTLYGNIVLNVANSRSLDARYDTALERYDNTQVANINKVMQYNIINGGLKIQGKPGGKNGCVKGKNILLYKQGEQPAFDIVVDNVETLEDDILLPYKTTKDRVIVVSRSTRRELRKLPFYDRIQQYITLY